MNFWTRYWFDPRPVLDIAIVRIVCCVTTLYFCVAFLHYHAEILDRALLDDTLYRPFLLFRLVHLPFGWGYSGSGGADGLGTWAFRPSGDFVLLAYSVFIVSGVMAAIGLLTRTSLLVFAASYFYVESYIFAYGDFHHPSAAMVIMLGLLALSPAGQVLSVDNVLRARRGAAIDLHADAPFAGWAIRLMQWFFALMYLSAFYSKLHFGGLDWMNGYTLQYYLIQDGLRWGSGLAVWVAQFHWLILLGQIGVMVFQGTFFLEVLFPRLRWIYIPIGLCLHISIYILLHAPFFTWIALYSIFIPWRDVADYFGHRSGRISQAGEL